MTNNRFQEINVELEKQISEKLSSMSDFEIEEMAKAHTSKTLKVGLTLSLIFFPFAILVAIPIPNLISSGSDLLIPCLLMETIFLLAIIYNLSSIFRVFKNSSHENARLFLVTELEKSAENAVEISEQQKRITVPDFVISKIFTIKTYGKSYAKLLIDSQNERFIFQTKHDICVKAYNFSDIVSYEIYENGKSQVQGRAGAALIGGAFFGLGGLIVGSSMSRSVDEKCTELKLIIRINDAENPQIIIPYIINSLCDKTGLFYLNARENLQDLCSLLEYIINSKTLEQSATAQLQSNTTKKSSKEQLQELKEMLDSGLITQEDYELKKKQILGL